MALTVAEVAGIINVGIVLFQVTFPLILMLVLVGLTARTNNAVTWSVTGRLLNGTWWPSILRTDTAATNKVSKKVLFISYYTAVGLILLAVTAVITPLGLYDGLAESTMNANFAYVRDSSPIGVASPKRDAYNVSRMCGFMIGKSCPGQFHGYTWNSNSTGYYAFWNNTDDYLSSVIPENLTQIFSSGRHGDLKTVASPFDLQYRTYTLKNYPLKTSVLRNITAQMNVDQERFHTAGEFETYDSFILKNSYVVHDGIVADMQNGGIGFRNHTLPAITNVGTEWSENLLWIEPETVCVNNNISVEFQTPRLISDRQAVYLVDNGGLLAIKKGVTYPRYDNGHSQDKTELYARAFRGATLMNYNLALVLNANSSDNGTYLGRRYRVPSTSSYQPNQMLFGRFHSGIPPYAFDIGMTDPSRNLSSKMIDNIELLVTGYGGADVANISRIAVLGGVVAATPRRVDKIANDRNDPGSNYNAPIYCCVSTLKAYIMNVTFFTNGSSSLDQLQVKKAVPRTYPAGSLPLWAIEKAADRFFVPDSDLIWGLVDDSYQNDPRFWTTRREHLYLPAGTGSFKNNVLYSIDSLAVGVPENILAMLFDGFTGSRYTDYMGKFSKSLAQKWANLSRSVETVPKIISLIWTDVAINMLTSRRSQLNADSPSVTTYVQAAAQNPPSAATVQVTSYSRVVKYRPLYAIPAILFCVAYLAVLVTAIVFRLMKRTTLPMLRTLLNQTSVGRAVLAERAASEDTNAAAWIKAMSTHEWVKEYGAEDIGVRKDVMYTALAQSRTGEKGTVHTTTTAVESSENESLNGRDSLNY